MSPDCPERFQRVHSRTESGPGGRSSWYPREGLWSPLSRTRNFQGLDRILKSRDITLPAKVRLVKATVFQWSCMDVSVGP